jgi:xanthine dehydrogenase YagS FAD-binding subunit
MFVSPSRLAPALVALGASVRIAGPAPDQVDVVPLEYFFVTPRAPGQHENVLQPNQILTHVLVPPAGGLRSATYEVLQMQGLDWPLASAAAALRLERGLVREAHVVLGHVAPTPWVSSEAARTLVGNSVTERTASLAGEAAVARATPLSRNGYKVQLARTAVKRAVLRAAGLPEGGL